jgi:hypothetical protein
MTKILKNRIVQFVVVAVASIALTAIFLPSKEIIVTRDVIKEVEVEKRVEVVKEVVVEKEIEKRIVVSEKKIKRVIEHPDGTRIEEEIWESNKDQIDRILESSSMRVAELREEYERQIEVIKEKKVVKTNPKRLSVFAGYNPIDHDTIGGASYRFAGPLTIGAAGTRSSAFVTLGIQF